MIRMIRTRARLIFLECKWSTTLEMKGCCKARRCQYALLEGVVHKLTCANPKPVAMRRNSALSLRDVSSA